MIVLVVQETSEPIFLYANLYFIHMKVKPHVRRSHESSADLTLCQLKGAPSQQRRCIVLRTYLAHYSLRASSMRHEQIEELRHDMASSSYSALFLALYAF